jgi:hypothetical protein
MVKRTEDEWHMKRVTYDRVLKDMAVMIWRTRMEMVTPNCVQLLNPLEPSGYYMYHMI